MIEVRVWDKKYEFMYPDAFDHPDYTLEDMLRNPSRWDVMFSTGLRDINNKTIYKHDDIRVLNEYHDECGEYSYYEIMRVVWFDELAGFGVVGGGYGEDSWQLGGAGWRQVEVFGNKWENPKLVLDGDVNNKPMHG